MQNKMKEGTYNSHSSADYFRCSFDHLIKTTFQFLTETYYQLQDTWK